MTGIYLSSGCIHNKKTGCDIRLLKECMQHLPISGIELMVIKAWYEDIDGLVDSISKLSIDIPILHIEKSVGEKLSQGKNTEAIEILKKNLHISKNLGICKAVLHLWHGQGSDRNLPNNIENLGIIQELSSEYDIELLVENIPCENTDEIQLMMDIADRYPEQRFVFDTKNAAFCDHMNENRLNLTFDHIPIYHIHLNDYSGHPRQWENIRKYSFPGEGDIDFQWFFKMLYQRSYSGNFTIETPITNSDGRIDFVEISRKIRKIIGINNFG
jgi:sugar phosphate isomerase/epimerase